MSQGEHRPPLSSAHLPAPWIACLQAADSVALSTWQIPRDLAGAGSSRDGACGQLQLLGSSGNGSSNAVSVRSCSDALPFVCKSGTPWAGPPVVTPAAPTAAVDTAPPPAPRELMYTPDAVVDTGGKRFALFGVDSPTKVWADVSGTHVEE